MTDLVIEDGTGVPTANSPVTTEEADEFFHSVGNYDWDNAADKEASIIQGTMFVDTRFNFIGWKGSRTYGRTGQGLAWPRKDVVSDEDGSTLPDTEMPVEYKRACMISAFISSQGKLNIITDRSVFVTSEQVGSLRTTYSQNDPFDWDGTGVPFSDLLDALLNDLLKVGHGSTIWLERA